MDETDWVSFATQMEGMVTDLQLARDKQVAFDDWKKKRERKLPIDLSVTVLTTGFWPSYKVDLAALSLCCDGLQGSLAHC